MGGTESYRGFDGFIMPDGEMVPIEDTERMFSIIVKGRESRDQITGFLWGLAKECWNSSYFKAAYDYFEKSCPCPMRQTKRRHVCSICEMPWSS